MKTIKQEIMDAVKNGGGLIKINEVGYLNRWTVSGIGEKVDEMELVLKVKGVRAEKHVRITERDYDGIIQSVERATTEFFEEIAETLNKNLRAGYR